MSKTLTADDLLPIVAALTPRERARLLRLIATRSSLAARSAYAILPPGPDEFSTDDDLLAWEGEGWDDVT